VTDRILVQSVTFRVPGQPVPKARPRVTERGTFTPQRTRDWEEAVGWAFKGMGAATFDGPVSVMMTFLRKGRRKVDLDNLVKSVLDGLNGVAFHDDQQVRELSARVIYGCDEPLAEVTVNKYRGTDG